MSPNSQNQKPVHSGNEPVDEIDAGLAATGEFPQHENRLVQPGREYETQSSNNIVPQPKNWKDHGVDGAE